MVAILSNQREAILHAVRSMYTQVATHPEQEYHFPTGRAACELVGYPAEVLDSLPVRALESFAGVGYPFAVGVIRSGDRVLDIGSGSGTDALIAASIVGPAGRVHALDITPAMLEKLDDTAGLAGLTNIHPTFGSGEEIPLPDGCVDVVTSNGVLNLIPDKEHCISEICRVLAPGGYVQIADVVLGSPVSETCRMDPTLWAECVVGATLQSEYVRMFSEAGFQCGVLGSLDYFAASSSQSTRNLAETLGACSMVLWAVKLPAGARVHRPRAWPPVDQAIGPSGEASEAAVRADDTLEALGVTCGLLEPMLKAKLRPMASGAVLEVLSDQPGARVGISSWARLTGHALLSVLPGEGESTRFLLRRK